MNRRSITDTVSLIVRKFEKKRSFEEAFVEFVSLIVYINIKTQKSYPGKDNILSGYFTVLS